jgi:hypothetical protein
MKRNKVVLIKVTEECFFTGEFDSPVNTLTEKQQFSVFIKSNKINLNPNSNDVLEALNTIGFNLN